MTSRAAEVPPIVYARVAGFAYVLIIVIGVFTGILIDSRLVVHGDSGATVNNILAHGFQFRMGTGAMLVLYCLVVILAVALYVVLKTVNKNLALLALAFRLAEAIVGFATVLLSLLVAYLVNDQASTAAFEADQLQAMVGLLLTMQKAGMDIVLVLIGVGGTIFCWLFWQSRYVPRILAAWGMFTYLSLLALAFTNILFPNHPAVIETVIYSAGAPFEVIIGLWLLSSGVKNAAHNGQKQPKVPREPTRG